MTDRWCEQRMWREWGLDTGGVEWLACVTGLAICTVPFVLPPARFTTPLCFLQAGFVLLGAGTFVYHFIPHDESHHVNAFDFFPMSFVCATLVYIFIAPLLSVSRTVETASLLVLLAWAGVLFIGMNQVNYSVLNAVLVTPPVLCLLAYTVEGHATGYVWPLLIASLALWLVNVFACHLWAPLAVLHSIYHITVALAVWEGGSIVGAASFIEGQYS